MTAPAPPAWCTPRFPCGKCYRCVQERIDWQSDAWAESHGVELPKPERARFLHDVNLKDSKLRAFGCDEKPGDHARAQQFQGVMRIYLEWIEARLVGLERAEAEYGYERSELARTAELIRFAYFGEHKGVVEGARQFGWKSHSSYIAALERIQAEAFDHERRLPVIVVRCHRCGAKIPYRMGGRPPRFCPRAPGRAGCKDKAYWARRGAKLRRSHRIVEQALRKARRKPSPPSA